MASAIYWFGELGLKPGERFTLAWLRKAGRVIDQFDQRLLEETIAACKQLGIELNPAFLNQVAGLVDYDQSQQLVEEAKEEKEGEDVLSSVVNYGNITVSYYDGGANDYSSSSSSSSGSYPGGGSGAVKTTELSDKGKEVLIYLSNNVQPINYEQAVADSNQDNSMSEFLAKLLSPWTEELPEDEQQHIMHIMRGVSKALVALTPAKLIVDQPIEEIHKAEYQKYYTEPDSLENKTDYAKVAQQDYSKLVGDLREMHSIGSIIQ